jgi:DNA-3-methyladenine glycosylase I
VSTGVRRCGWAESADALLRAYHDEEWGVPEHDNRALWEALTLDTFQAGLSWITILRKRDAFRRAFRGFVPAVVAGFGERDVSRLLKDKGIVRSEAKIRAAIGNAKAYLAMERSGVNFSRFVWSYVGGRQVLGGRAVLTQSVASEEISTALKGRGFKFVGPVTVYAWMQAVGLVNDHEPDCFRRDALTTSRAPPSRVKRAM